MTLTITPPAGPYPTIAASYTSVVRFPFPPPPLLPLLLAPPPIIELFICSIISPRSNAIDSPPALLRLLRLLVRQAGPAATAWGDLDLAWGTATTSLPPSVVRAAASLTADPWRATKAVVGASKARRHRDRDAHAAACASAGRMVLLLLLLRLERCANVYMQKCAQKAEQEESMSCVASSVPELKYTGSCAAFGRRPPLRPLRVLFAVSLTVVSNQTRTLVPVYTLLRSRGTTVQIALLSCPHTSLQDESP